MTATITYPNDEASRGLYVVTTSSDLLLILVQRLAITYPDGEVSRGLDVATASDPLPVLVQRLAPTLMMSRCSEGCV